MLSLSETVERKFVDSLEIDEWEIESSSGWIPITHINKTIEYDVWILETESGIHLECADKHIVFTDKNIEVFVESLQAGDKLYGHHGIEVVKSVYKTNRKEHMYDLSVGGDHTFFAEGLKHHNTATTAAYVLWAVLFNKRYTIGIVANKAAAAKEVLSRVKDMYEQLPIWIQEGVERWNMFDIKLENGSTVFCAATTASGLRGKSINMLVIDEAAIIPNTIASEFFTSTFPTISSGKKTKVVMISTPLGYNHFWKFWVEAEQGKNGFVPVRVFWYEHPKRDQAWADEQLKILGDVKFAQEVDCAFQGSAYTLISGKALSELAMMKPIQEDEFFRLHEHVKQNNVYVVICDPAEGVGGDNSAVTVVNISNFPYTIAATYKNNKISSVALPDVIYKLAKEFNDAYIMCEINKFEDVARTLHDEFEYENMIQITHDKRGQVANGGWGSKTKYGVMTTKQVKRLGCATLKQLIETKKLLVTDSEVISELSTFIEKKGTYMADEGYTDDLAMTLVLFAWLTTQPLFKELSEKSERKILFNDIISKATEQLMPFGFFDDGVTNTDEVEDGWVKVDISGHFY